MATEMTYNGWTIRYGFLDGNLGNEECVAHAKDFATAVEEALTEAFPGAEIQVQWQHASGSIPWSIRTAAFNDQGDGDNDLVARICQIAEDVYQSYTWLE